MTQRERKIKNEKFATALRTLRTGSGMTKEKVAAKLDVKIMTYISYEQGYVEPSLATFAAVCKLYKIPVEQRFKLFGLE